MSLSEVKERNQLPDTRTQDSQGGKARKPGNRLSGLPAFRLSLLSCALCLVSCILLLIHAHAVPAFGSLGVGARPAGMGNSFVAVADDVNCTYWNPAGLGTLRRKEITLMYSPLYAISAISMLDKPGMSQQFLSYAHPIPDYGTAGINIIRLNLGDILWTGPDAGIRGSLSVRQTVLTICHGRQFTPTVTFGAGIKGVLFELGDEVNSSWTVDLGGLIDLGDRSTLGFCLRNINEASTAASGGEKNAILTSAISAGLDYRASSNLRIVSSLTNRNLQLGIEYWEADILALRFGLQEDPFNPKQIPILSGGIGVEYSLWQLDYAYIFHRDLSDVHYVSLTMRIGETSQSP
jgi:hypothetical protein